MISNIHTHSLFCDGKDEPEAMVKRALELGFTSLGFSSHSPNGFDPCGMRNEAGYRAEILRLKSLYGDRIKIYCGIEQDIFSGRTDPFYDYSIGSVHYVDRNGKKLAVDWSKEETERIIGEEYSGDADAFSEDYYSLAAQVYGVTHCNIIGHFDLITKFDENGEVFKGQRYRNAAMSALEALCKNDVIFEINTGAMSRGYRKTPYPALWILRELNARNARVIITTDCHDKNYLDYGYDVAADMARKAGFTSQCILKNGKFIEAGL